LTYPATAFRNRQSHWSEDWINAAGFGGSYWPYLNQVNIHQLLTQGLIDSISSALGPPRKPHTTIWAPVFDAPSGSAALSKPAQDRLFRVAVHNTPTSVQLLIITPIPPGAENAT
jgi:hypothetical protein